jgi:hypothetical protein
MNKIKNKFAYLIRVEILMKIEKRISKKRDGRSKYFLIKRRVNKTIEKDKVSLKICENM